MKYRPGSTVKTILTSISRVFLSAGEFSGGDNIVPLISD
jgi:hypothetical protein